MKNLIKNILVVDPAHRYTANEIASHPWSTGSKDSQTNMPTNVLTMMKDYAKIMAEESLDHVSACYLLNIDRHISVLTML